MSKPAPRTNRQRQPRYLHVDWDDIIDYHGHGSSCDDYDCDDNQYAPVTTSIAASTAPPMPPLAEALDWALALGAQDLDGVPAAAYCNVPLQSNSSMPRRGFQQQDEDVEHELWIPRKDIPDPPAITLPTAIPSPTTEGMQKHQWNMNGILLPSSLGPQQRGILVVRAVKAKVVALIPFPPPAGSEVTVLLVGNPMEDDHREAFVKAVRCDLVKCRSDQGALFDSQREYREMCKRMTSMSSQWSDLLEQRVPSESNGVHDVGRAVLLQQGFQASQQAVGQVANLFDTFVAYVEQAGIAAALMPPVSGVEHAVGTAAKATPGWNVACLICMDELPTGLVTTYFRMEPCGHGVCSDCWAAYLQSVALSGQSTTISCPAHKCQSTIGLLDFPHILFGSDAALSDQDAQSLFSTLVSNEATVVCKRESQGRRCPSLGCENTLVPVPGPPDEYGRRIAICCCGITVCSDCPVGRNIGTHPGLSCVEYGNLRDEIDSGKADAEYESYQYVLKHSRPCPQCGVSVERTDGCNHMRCGKCQYYYCWECGGVGHLCNAYGCRKVAERKLYESSNETLHARDQLAPKIKMYRSYRVAHDRLQQLDKTIQSIGDVSTMKPDIAKRLQILDLERQIKQVALWIRLFLFHQGNGITVEEVCQPLQRLELLDHARETRERVSRNSESSNGAATPEQIAEAMGVVRQAQTKRVVYRHRKALASEKLASAAQKKSFEELIADQELLALCTMNIEQFHIEVREAIEMALKLLFPLAAPVSRKQANGSRRNRKSRSLAEDHMELNEKQERVRPNWNNDNCSSPTPPTSDTVIRWKGKDRVRIRREHNLDGQT